MSEFSRIALRKLNDLLVREDFLCVISIGNSVVNLMFNTKSCSIDCDGRVKWSSNIEN